MGDPTKALIDELCSLLDEATILSIARDYDLDKPAEFAAARGVLLTISKDVEAEEASGFNPSGFGGDDLAGFSVSNEGADSGATDGDLKSNDGLTTTTESSHSRVALSSSSSNGSEQEIPGTVHVSVLDHLTIEEKERRLAAMFISLKPIDIKLTLQKVKGDADLAIDELLNLQLLEQTGQRLKGVDGFYVSDEDVPKTKKKGKRKAAKVARVKASSADMPTTSKEPSRDEGVDDDNIGFISDHFALSIPEAADLYQRNNLSIGTAILSLLDNYISFGLQPSNSFSQLRLIEEEKKRIPWIPHDYFGPIFNTTATSEAAIDVINELARHFKKPAHLKYDISYSVVASTPEVATEIPLSPGSEPSWKHVSSSGKSQTAQRLRVSPLNLEEVNAARASIDASMKHSYASASSAFRKGKSNPLMGQAASFYSDRARTEAAMRRQVISMEAELLVDRQSTSDTIDLHGVSVQDGVKIAIDRVWRWWDALGRQDRARRAARDGLKVVTGIGRHTRDGKSRLRANVCKALIADGWKLEVLTGAYLVTGRS